MAARFCLVGRVGRDPTMVNPADLRSAAIAARRLQPMSERAELESDTDFRYNPLSMHSPDLPGSRSIYSVEEYFEVCDNQLRILEFDGWSNNEIADYKL